MDDKLALEILSELPNSNFWSALQFYNRQKDSWALNTLGSLDVFKEPTSAARAQGIRIGVFFLEKEILEFLEEKRKKEEQSQDDDENYVRKE